MYTTASVFLKTLAQAGITHAFVNWGNDHPAILEDLERQRVENDGKSILEIVTCPNEMVALSAAHGYAEVTRKPAAVIVHVDVGTQALAGAVHNVDKGRAPVLIFAGASPHTAQGELKGSKNEWPMWPQDAPDQSAIVRQYMRYIAQILSGRNVAKMVMRALQFATSDPQGPVYLYARREVLEEEVEPSVMDATPDVSKWPPIHPGGLSPDAVQTIVQSLLSAQFPLIITANAGRNPQAVSPLLALSELLSIALYTSVPMFLCVPYSHTNFVGSSNGGRNVFLDEADVILIVDSDLPWIDQAGNAPRPGARVFIVDQDPLKSGMGWSHVDAELICRADAEVATNQLIEAANAASKDGKLNVASVKERGERLRSLHADWIRELEAVEVLPQGQTVATTPMVLATLRKAVEAQTPGGGQKTLWLNECTSAFGLAWNHIRPERPGSFLTSGASSLGWALGAAVGAQMGVEVAQQDYKLTVALVGDGTYIFGVPSAAYWMARRYSTPFLTVILNNGGWASPRLSMLGIYPTGHGSKVSGSRLSIGFGPDMPDHSGIAAAAGGAWARRVDQAENLREVLEEAIRVVVYERRCAVVDCLIDML